MSIIRTIAVAAAFLSLSPSALAVDSWDPPSDTITRIEIPYGNNAQSHPRRKYDVYTQKGVMPVTGGRPVIFMVHGGGWDNGDKRNEGVVKNKVLYYVPRGFVLISVAYPLMEDDHPEVHPVSQADDIALALAHAQQNTGLFNGARDKFVLMGHSAGAHLVTMVSVRSPSASITAPVGTVALDAASLNVPVLMHNEHLPLYDEAFGEDEDYWYAASPYHVMVDTPTPPIMKHFLTVCGSERVLSCPVSAQFVLQAPYEGMAPDTAWHMPICMNHSEVNVKLGEDLPYTRDVNFYLKKMHPDIAALLPPGGDGEGEPCE